MIQVSSFLALTNSSLLLCILGLVITYVLLQEQRRLVDTNAATAVSMVMPLYLVFVVNLDILTGCVSRRPEHKELWFPADCDCL